MPWLMDIVAGIALAAIFYGLVRVRMYIAPILRDRYGAPARWTVWVIVGLLMITVANLGLLLLRQALHDQFNLTASFFHELLFASIAFGGGLVLVVLHVTRGRHKKLEKLDETD
jgi:hypothetical protein